MASYLVVANKTLGGDGLGAQLRRVIDSDRTATFVVIVPLQTPVAMDSGGAMGGIAVSYSDVAYFEEAAQERLTALLDWFRDARVNATGEIVRGDPLVAIDRVVRSQRFDEIIVSTLPARFSRWLRLDLPQKMARRFQMRVTTVTPTDSNEELPRAPSASRQRKKDPMTESVYKIIELVGTSTESWEKAAAAAVSTASRSLRDLRVAEVAELDLVIEDGEVSAYRGRSRCHSSTKAKTEPGRFGAPATSFWCVANQRVAAYACVRPTR